MFKNSSFYIFQMLHIQTYAFLLIRRKNPHQIYIIFKYIFYYVHSKLYRWMFIAALVIRFKAGKQLWCPSEVAYGDTCLPHKLLRQDKWAVDIPWHNIIQTQRETTKPQGTWRKAQSTLLKEGSGLYVVTSEINQSKAKWQRVTVANGREHLGRAQAFRALKSIPQMAGVPWLTVEWIMTPIPV